jgi:hypothetical protein
MRVFSWGVARRHSAQSSVGTGIATPASHGSARDFLSNSAYIFGLEEHYTVTGASMNHRFG